MNSGLKFLVVDDVDDNRYLLAKTLLRKFPDSTCIECRSSATALAAARDEKPVAVVVHRADDLDGPGLIRQIRAAGVRAPIVMVSGRSDCPEAIAAGATTFLHYDAWLRIGVVVEEILGPNFAKASTPSPSRASIDFLGARNSGQATRASQP